MWRNILRTEIGIRVCGSLRRFDVGKHDAIGLRGGPVNYTLVTENVDARRIGTFCNNRLSKSDANVMV